MTTSEDKDFNVTPWEVSGDIDYEKLVKKFGTTLLSEELLEKLRLKTKSKTLHPFLKRGFIYSHRDLDKIIDGIDQNNFFVYTGRGPSGDMHIGHLISFITAKWLQDEFDCNVYIAMADDEKFTVKSKLSLDDVKKQGQTDFENIAALGFNPDKTFFFSDIEFIEKLYPRALEFSKKTTFSTAKGVFGFGNESNLGHLFYPNIQIVPTTFEKKHCLIPAGIDQDPYWRIQRDNAEKIGYKKVVAIHNKLVSPLEGISGKMSSSGDNNSAIYLTDDPKTISKKINKYAFTGGQPTLEEQKEKGGNPDICVVYSWLEILFEDNDKKLKQRCSDCKAGKILCGECKKYLGEKVGTYITNHQNNKDKNKKLIDQYKYNGKLAKQMWQNK